MRNGFFPVFTKGRVLKRESIEYLRDFPYDLASLAIEQYSDGLLFGFYISSEDEYIRVAKGALKYRGDIIVVPESTILMEKYGVFSYVKLDIGEFSESEDSKICNIEVKIDSQEAVAENELEVGRFCLNHGAILRCKYDSFSDLRTLENTLDVTRVLYAGYSQPTLHPRVLKEYAKALLEASSEAADVAFALMCLNSAVIHKSSIEWHIAKKRDRDYEEFTLPVLYEKLEMLLPQRGLIGKRERPRGRGPSIV
jgi:hypothetical protein